MKENNKILCYEICQNPMAEKKQTWTLIGWKGDIIFKNKYQDI